MTTAVLFDLDDTLFDHRGCAREALSAVQQQHERLRTLPFAVLERHHAQFLEELHREVMLGRLPLETARVERFSRLLGAAGVADGGSLAASLAALYRDTYRTARRAVAGARAVLEAIKPRAQIAIVSNNLFDEQQDKLKTCGLDVFVDALVVSEQAGIPKPDPAIFHLALERLGAAPEDAVVVGDSWAADIAGARAAGIRAIWFNPSAAAAPSAERVDELRAFEPPDAAVRMILDTHRD